MLVNTEKSVSHIGCRASYTKRKKWFKTKRTYWLSLRNWTMAFHRMHCCLQYFLFYLPFLKRTYLYSTFLWFSVLLRFHVLFFGRFFRSAIQFHAMFGIRFSIPFSLSFLFVFLFSFLIFNFSTPQKYIWLTHHTFLEFFSGHLMYESSSIFLISKLITFTLPQ